MSVFTQGFISGFALITPWALQECRAYGTRNLTEFLMRVFSTRKCNTGFANLDRKLYAVALEFFVLGISDFIGIFALILGLFI